ncbi:hypothetical protein HDE_08994 [Halotydeus destructor]|nr:hypothetical protein HDE_08994 [Halotydeus destructor]
MIGCLWQTIAVSYNYFRYKTTTQLILDRSNSIVPPKVIICFGISDVIDGNKVNEKYGRVVPATEVATVVTKASTKDLFYLTYDAENIVQSRQFSNSTSGILYNDVEGATLKVNKMIRKKNFVCYDFHLRDGVDYSATDMTIANDQLYFVVKFNTSFKPVKMITLHLHDRHLSNYGGKRDAVYFYSDVASKGVTSFKSALITYKKTVNDLLSQPYDTDCTDYPVKSMNEFGKIFDMVTFFESHNTALISESQLRSNRSLSKVWQTIQSNCSNQCRRFDCHSEDHAPRLLGSVDKPMLVLALYASNQPTLHCRALEQFLLVDYIILVMSSVAFWFGFSPFCSLVNLDVISRLRSRKAEERKAMYPAFQRRHLEAVGKEWVQMCYETGGPIMVVSTYLLDNQQQLLRF